MIWQAKFLTSSFNQKNWLNEDIYEVCFVGRSNVGKSTFINAFTNQKKLAKTSSTPGKTRLLNFFDINNQQFRIVDSPGYGYAKVNKKEKEKFAQMMDEYLTKRKQLKFVCLFVDLRHKPSAEDIEMYNFLKYYNIKVFIIATKKDKCKKNDILKNEKIIKETLKIDEKDNFISISSIDKVNFEKIFDIFQKYFNMG